MSENIFILSLIIVFYLGAMFAGILVGRFILWIISLFKKVYVRTIIVSRSDIDTSKQLKDKNYFNYYCLSLVIGRYRIHNPQVTFKKITIDEKLRLVKVYYTL